MIIKESVFAQAGKQDPERTQADYRTGMIPNTVAMAEDVNTYGNWSDRDLKVVCDEIVNALEGQGITPNDSYVPNDSRQLDVMLRTKLRSGFFLTGLNYDTYTTAPVQNGASIEFPELTVTFNSTVYYANTQDGFDVVTIPAQTLTANSTWEDGPNFIWATNTGTITHGPSAPQAKDSATVCYLGSVFVDNGSFQANSWNFSPWLQITTASVRESPTATRKGGFISPAGGLKLQMGAVEIMSEGINFANNPQQPSIISFPARTPPTSYFTYKYLYPTYNPSAADQTDIDTTHIYDMTNDEWVDISEDYAGKFICLVPCILPSGQTLMIPAMSYKVGEVYTSVFDTIEDATKAVYGLQYKLNKVISPGVYGNNVAARCVYLGQTIIVRVAASDFEDVTQYASVGQLPQALAGFTEASGQTGGGAGAYIPMPESVATDNFTASTNQATVVEGRTDHAIQVSFLQPQPNIVNQLEIKYKHEEGMLGLTFPNGQKWWGSEPQWVVGNTYLMVFEYVVDQWIGGYLTLGTEADTPTEE